MGHSHDLFVHTDRARLYVWHHLTCVKGDVAKLDDVATHDDMARAILDELFLARQINFEDLS